VLCLLIEIDQNLRELMLKRPSLGHQDLTQTCGLSHLRSVNSHQMRTEKINFNKRYIESLPSPKGLRSKDYYDAAQRGLTLRVTDTGSKSFYFRKTVNYKIERVFLGRFPDMSVEQARDAAAQHLADVGKGISPQSEKHVSNEEPTLGELFENYLEGHARIRCVRVADMEKDFVRYVADWRDRKWSSIKRADVQNRVNHVRQNNGPAAANHIIILMKAMMSWNIRNGYIEGDNPWLPIKQFKIQSRERFLRPNELANFFAALRKVPDETMRDYFEISLYTGARKSNVLAMRWEDVDLDLAIWRIPMTKNKESHLVPLTGPAVEILRRRAASNKTGWVFPGRMKDCHLVEPKRVWYKLVKDAGVEDLRVHDLRRTLASYMAITNHSLPIIARALGHKSTQATQIYSRLTQDPVRNAMDIAIAQIHLLSQTIEDENDADTEFHDSCA